MMLKAIYQDGKRFFSKYIHSLCMIFRNLWQQSLFKNIWENQWNLENVQFPKFGYLRHERPLYHLVSHINSLAPGKFEQNFRHVNFKHTLVIDGWGIFCKFALIWMSLDFTDAQSTLVQVMAWCRQATSHYPSQCLPRSLSLYGVTRPQCVKATKAPPPTLPRNPKGNSKSVYGRNHLAGLAGIFD